MAPPHSKRLGLKYVIVHFRNDLTQSQVIHNQVDNTSTYTYLQSTIVGTQLLQGLGGNCMGNNLGYMSLVLMSYSKPRAYITGIFRYHHGVRLIAVLSDIEVWGITVSACAHCLDTFVASGSCMVTRNTSAPRASPGSLEWELKITSWGGNTTAFKK
jgi:hypothetical protein